MTKKDIESKLTSLGYKLKISDTGINWTTFIACVYTKVTGKGKDIGDAAIECRNKMKD